MKVKGVTRFAKMQVKVTTVVQKHFKSVSETKTYEQSTTCRLDLFEYYSKITMTLLSFSFYSTKTSSVFLRFYHV